jgi:hypothetical protein
MDSFFDEVKKRWGDTKAFEEFTEKTKNISDDKLGEITDGMSSIFGEFAACMKSGAKCDSAEAKALVGKLKQYITDNFYTCTNGILSYLGQMYVNDARFKDNIDKNGEGTADFVFRAISSFVK